MEEDDDSAIQEQQQRPTEQQEGEPIGKDVEETKDEEPQASGLLSPRRIEAIHIAFNNVFENARKEGLLRSPSTYLSFDKIFEIAMKRRAGEYIEEEEEEETQIIEEDTMDYGDVQILEDTTSFKKGHVEVVVKSANLNKSHSTPMDEVIYEGEYTPGKIKKRRPKRSEINLLVESAPPP
jgi:hypothetical protein